MPIDHQARVNRFTWYLVYSDFRTWKTTWTVLIKLWGGERVFWSHDKHSAPHDENTHFLCLWEKINLDIGVLTSKEMKIFNVEKGEDGPKLVLRKEGWHWFVIASPQKPSYTLNMNFETLNLMQKCRVSPITNDVRCIDK